MKRKALALVIIVLLFPSVLTVVDVKAEENSWITLAPMSTPRASFDAAVVDGKIYAIGGTSNLNEEYDPSSNTWTTKAAVPTARSTLVTVAVQNKIYAIGGYAEADPGIPTAINEAYDPTTDTWETKAEMPTARGQMCANNVNDQVYVIGGFVWVRYYNVEPCNKTEAYNPATNTWTTKAEMPYPTVNPSSVVIGDKIYVLTSPIQIYDTLTDSWSLGSFPTTVQSDADAVVVLDEGGRELIYIFGGNGSGTYLNLVQIYDPQIDVWGVGSPMPTPRYGLAVEGVDNEIYALGGTTAGGAYGYGTLLSTNERYTPLEAGSLLPTPTPTLYPTPTSTPEPTPTFTPEPTATPTEEPEQTEQDMTAGAVLAVTSIVVFVGLLFYFIKRK